jgi:hypothetical protein
VKVGARRAAIDPVLLALPTPAAPTAAPPLRQFTQHACHLRVDRLDAEADGRFVRPLVRIETFGPLAQPVAFFRHTRAPQDPVEQIAKALSKAGRVRRPEDAAQ